MHLENEIGVVNPELRRQKIRANRGSVLGAEPMVHVLIHQGGLTDPETRACPCTYSIETMLTRTRTRMPMHISRQCLHAPESAARQAYVCRYTIALLMCVPRVAQDDDFDLTLLLLLRTRAL